jgi:hypothetical protein
VRFGWSCTKPPPSLRRPNPAGTRGWLTEGWDSGPAVQHASPFQQLECAPFPENPLRANGSLCQRPPNGFIPHDTSIDSWPIGSGRDWGKGRTLPERPSPAVAPTGRFRSMARVVGPAGWRSREGRHPPSDTLTRGSGRNGVRRSCGPRPRRILRLGQGARRTTLP